ncbi:MAG TPA: endonuclease domain-containing protein [Rubricoccaceae bacterium]|nr:endonuclease domain-containing protein [Rubricoccaceae bacterium]
MARLHNRPRQKVLRRDLRNHATRAEQALWRRLKGRALRGRKFRRQHGIGRYVVDFYCPSERLAVELDGAPHRDPLRAAYDAQRQRDLEALGIRVLRFENREVLERPDFVLTAIASCFTSEANAGLEKKGRNDPPPPQTRRGPGGG